MSEATLTRKPFKIPPLVPQTISRRYANPKWWRFEFIAFCAINRKWSHGAELGVLAGKTLNHLMMKVPRLHMIGVDLFEEQPENKGPETWQYGERHSAHYANALQLAKQFEGRLDIMKMKTNEAAPLVPDGSLDFVFIDADHSYDGCRDDIVNWSPKLKPGGWLMGHDIQWPGVRQAVEELCPHYEIGPNVTWFCPVDASPGWCPYK